MARQFALFLTGLVVFGLILSAGDRAVSAPGVTSNVLLRVKRIIAGPASGTAFSVEVDERQYLVTAKHVVAALGEVAKIKLCDDSAKCSDFEIEILRCEDPIDIAVLVPKTQVTVAHPLPLDLKGAIVGQDMFFVGFPFGDYSLTTRTANETIGFVRKGTFSAQQRTEKFTRIYLDGRNNKGFSGSPVVYVEPGQPANKFKVAGVVSGFRSDLSDVLQVDVIEKKAIKPEDMAANRIVQMADGTFRKLTPTGRYVADNTGIVVAYAIDHAVDLIKKSEKKGPKTK